MDIVTNLKERSEWKDGISYREQAALQRLMLTGTLDNAAYNWTGNFDFSQEFEERKAIILQLSAETDRKELKEIVADKANVQEARKSLEQKIAKEEIILDAENYIGREITLENEDIPFPDVSFLTNHTTETERSFIMKEAAVESIGNCDIVLSADDYISREIIFQESSVDKSLKNLLDESAKTKHDNRKSENSAL